MMFACLETLHKYNNTVCIVLCVMSFSNDYVCEINWLLCIVVFYCHYVYVSYIILLYNMPFYECITVYLSIPLLMDIWVVSSLLCQAGED